MDNLQLFQSKCSPEKDQVKKQPVVECRKELRKKLKHATKANESLEVSISHKNAEINDLRRAVQTLNTVINSVPIEDMDKGAATASCKILDLSKRNRILKSELDGSHNKISKLELRIKRLEADLSKTSRHILTEKSKEAEKKAKLIQNGTIETLQTELQNTKQKLFETLNQNQELKNNIKLAQKCVQHEIGASESVNFNVLLASNSNWRGRQQQILGLQNKVNELKERLSMTNHYEDNDRNKLQIRKMESMRKQELGELQKINQENIDIIEAQKQKINALKLRNQTLIHEGMAYKEKTLSLIEQSGINDGSINLLNEKMAVQKGYYEAKIEQILKETENQAKQGKEIAEANKQLQTKIESMYVSLIEKDKTISELNEKLMLTEKDLKAIAGDFLYSCRDLKKGEFMAILDCLETEKNDLVKYNQTLIERVETERSKLSNLVEQNSQLKIKISRLESKINIYQKDKDKEQERQKRLQRITDFTNSLSSSRMSSISFDNPSMMESVSANQAKSNEQELEVLKNRVEIYNEKVNFLEEKLSYISLERDQDEKAFNDIINNTKSKLLDTICQIKRVDTTNEFETQQLITLET